MKRHDMYYRIVKEEDKSLKLYLNNLLRIMMNSKKIGIITLPLHMNYGGVIQAYALCLILKKNNFEPYILQNKVSGVKQRLKRIIDRHSPIAKFTLGNIPVLEIDYDRMLDECVNANIGTIVVGSDQIWRPAFFDVNISFCLWAKNSCLRCISYAASFGYEDWRLTEMETEIACRGIRHFSAISVREDSAVELCEKYLATRAVHVLDPTMLLEPAQYRVMCKPIKEKYVFCYLLASSDKVDLSVVSAIKDRMKLPIRKIFLSKNKIQKRIQRTNSIENWLSLLNSAEFVITDSFHGTVFSILFNRPFYVLRNNAGGNSRIYSLLKMFNLENRLITTLDDMTEKPINWKSVNYILEEWKRKSLNFLNDALHD